MDGIPISLDVLAPSALCGLFVLLVFTGRLVPRKTYDDKAHEAEEWRAEGRIKDQQIAVKDEQIAEKDAQLRHLGEVGRTVEAIMRAIQTPDKGEVAP